MVDIEATVEVTLVCSNCGKAMEGEFSVQKNWINVDPCESCLKFDEDRIAELEEKIEQLEAEKDE